MNQHQRKYLLEQVDRQRRIEMDALEATKPKEPSLNNYLVASVLDGSFKLKSESDIRNNIRAIVRDLGRGDSMIESRYDRRDEDTQVIRLPVLSLFEEPPEYTAAFEEYQMKKTAWDAQRKLLADSTEAMKLKIQIGSDKALDQLVQQVDKLCSMSLTQSSKLLLNEPK